MATTRAFVPTTSTLPLTNHSTARPRVPQALSNEVDGDAVKCMEIECSKSEESKDFCKRVGSW